MTNMYSVNKLLALFLKIFIMVQTSAQLSNPTSVTVTSPVVDVEEGQILSIHCKIENMKEGQEVAIIKRGQGSSPVKVSANEKVSVSDTRVFIARRTLHDGSTVYFLSIIDVRFTDNGVYFCKVTEYTQDLEELHTRDVATGNVNVQILHFPEPTCGSNVKGQAKEGDLLKFNCSAGPANPLVTIEWTVAGSGKLPRSATFVETQNNGFSNSVMDFVARAKDNGAVFICSVKSKAFPGKFKTCHVGTIYVEQSGSLADTEESETLDDILVDDFIIPPAQISTYIYDSNSITNEIDCELHCKWFTTNIMYWVISTVIVGIIAFIFFIFALVLIIKYCRLTDPPHPESLNIHPNQVEQIYSELELKRGDLKRGDVKQYMALIKPASNTVDIMSPKGRDHSRFDENITQ